MVASTVRFNEAAVRPRTRTPEPASLGRSAPIVTTPVLPARMATAAIPESSASAAVRPANGAHAIAARADHSRRSWDLTQPHHPSFGSSQAMATDTARRPSPISSSAFTRAGSTWSAVSSLIRASKTSGSSGGRGGRPSSSASRTVIAASVSVRSRCSVQLRAVAGKSAGWPPRCLDFLGFLEPWALDHDAGWGGQGRPTLTRQIVRITPRSRRGTRPAAVAG